MNYSDLTCIVDDSADYRLLTQLYFQQFCPEQPIRLFASGKGLLEALHQMSQLPKLILLDRHMDGYDGHRTLEWLKRHPVYKRIPVVMISADASIREIDDCYESGANSFLKKSIDPIATQESMLAVCKYWLNMNQTPNLV